MPIDTKALRYLRLRQAHPDMTPYDAMELATQQPEGEAPAAPVPLVDQVKAPEVPPPGGNPPGMDPSELEQYEAPPSPPPVVQALGQPPEKAPEIDEKANAAELAAAQEADRKSRLTAGMELAGRQLVAGLTRTGVPEGIGARPDSAPGVVRSQGAKRDQLKEYLARKRQEGLDTSTKNLQESEIAKNFAEAMKARVGKPAGDGPESLRMLLKSPVYADALAKKGMSPAAVDALGEAGLKDLVAQLKTDTTNEATVQAGRESAGINASRSLSNAKNLKEWESNLPKNMPPEFIDQLEGLKGSPLALDQFEQNLAKTSTLAGKAGASGLPGASQGILGSGAEQGSTFEADRERTAIALARGLEGGMARPGNVEIIQRILPHANDSESVKKQKVTELRSFMESKKAAFSEAMRAGNYKGVDAATATTVKPAARTTKPSPGPGYVRAMVNGHPGWVNQKANDWEPD